MIKLVFAFILTLLLISPTLTQAQQKKNLTPEDYGKWQSLAGTALSPNGEWMAYQVSVQEDNDTLYVQNRVTNKQYKLEFGSLAEFSNDNQWIAYRIGLP